MWLIEFLLNWLETLFSVLARLVMLAVGGLFIWYLVKGLINHEALLARLQEWLVLILAS